VAVRLLYLADIRFPLERANGIQTIETCHALARRGHLVTLVVRPDTRKPPRDPLTFYGLEAIPQLRLARTAAAGPAWARRLQYLLHALTRALLTDRADLVLTRDLGIADMLLALPRPVRSPVIYESHGFAPTVGASLPDLLGRAPRASARKQRRLLARERRVWQRADGYVTMTAGLAAELEQRFGRRRHVTTIPDGARTAGGSGASWEPGPVPVVAYAGHLYPWKGVDVVINALALVPEVVGLIVGGYDGEPDLERTRKLAARTRVEPRVRFTGQVPPSDVAGHLASADILVLPNPGTAISTRYTSPLKLFEYMAAGKPIVASDLPAIREVLRDRENAVLFEAGNPQALAEALKLVVQDRALGGRVARQAREEAAHYSWDRRAERLEALMERVARC
jgi:glycosyltransferase involved in cell wall biosynthesis